MTTDVQNTPIIIAFGSTIDFDDYMPLIVLTCGDFGQDPVETAIKNNKMLADILDACEFGDLIAHCIVDMGDGYECPGYAISTPAFKRDSDLAGELADIAIKHGVKAAPMMFVNEGVVVIKYHDFQEPTHAELSEEDCDHGGVELSGTKYWFGEKIEVHEFIDRITMYGEF